MSRGLEDCSLDFEETRGTLQDAPQTLAPRNGCGRSQTPPHTNILSCSARDGIKLRATAMLSMYSTAVLDSYTHDTILVLLLLLLFEMGAHVAQAGLDPAMCPRMTLDC